VKKLIAITLYFTLALHYPSVWADSPYSLNAIPVSVTLEDVQKAEAISEDNRPESAVNVIGATTVNASDAKKLFDNHTLFIDVRRNNDWEAGHIPGAHHLFLDNDFTTENLQKIIPKKSTEMVIYCNGKKCLRSSAAVSLAVKWGYTNVSYFRDGFPAWVKYGNPIE